MIALIKLTDFNCTIRVCCYISYATSLTTDSTWYIRLIDARIVKFPSLIDSRCDNYKSLCPIFSQRDKSNNDRLSKKFDMLKMTSAPSLGRDDIWCGSRAISRSIGSQRRSRAKVVSVKKHVNCDTPVDLILLRCM